MTEKTDTEMQQPSEEYKNFEALLKQVLSVPKEEMDARIKADKQERTKRSKADTK